MDTCLAVTIVIIISGILLVGAIIAIALLASLPYAELIRFDQYTADCYTYYMDPDSYLQANLLMNVMPRVEFTKEYVFNEYKWFVDSYSGGKVSSRAFSTGNDGFSTTCMHIGGHDNCFVKTNYGGQYFSIPGTSEVKLINSEADCSFVSALAPNRKPTKCDIFTYVSGNYVVTAYVESNTGYPVLEQFVSAGIFEGAIKAVKVYDKFVPEKPSDESGLQPFPGVTIYDFRNGKGDAGDGKTNEFTETSVRESTMQYIRNVLSKKGTAKESNKNVDPYLQAIHLNAEVRDLLHLPPKGLSGNGIVHSREYSLREETIPESFDSRTAWENCSSVISTITNQAMCGSCWAMSSSGVLSDRLCIAKGIKQQLSPQYLMYCSMNNNGCNGGQTISTWEDIVSIGTTPEACVPFVAANGKCPERCEDGTNITEDMKVHPTGYVLPWGKTKEERVKAIQKEIMAHGPVQGSIWTFSDFQTHLDSSSDIYHRSADATWSGGHAIRIIGWGTESGVDYWLCANSWGTQNPGKGFFRIRRGNNECNIEEQVAAGIFA